MTRCLHAIRNAMEGPGLSRLANYAYRSKHNILTTFDAFQERLLNSHNCNTATVRCIAKLTNTQYVGQQSMLPRIHTCRAVAIAHVCICITFAEFVTIAAPRRTPYTYTNNIVWEAQQVGPFRLGRTKVMFVNSC